MSIPAFVYVAPARYEDILKLGFSHDPCDRIRSFHPRWFDYFDLERGFVLSAVDEKDARRIELLLAHALAEHRAQAPLVIAERAGGFTEWYRGAYAALRQSAEALVRNGGYAPLECLGARMRERLLHERDQLFERSVAMMDAIDGLGDVAPATTLCARLHALLDGYAALEIGVEEYLSEEVRDWLCRNGFMPPGAPPGAALR